MPAANEGERRRGDGETRTAHPGGAVAGRICSFFGRIAWFRRAFWHPSPGPVAALATPVKRGNPRITYWVVAAGGTRTLLEDDPRSAWLLLAGRPGLAAVACTRRLKRPSARCWTLHAGKLIVGSQVMPASSLTARLLVSRRPVRAARTASQRTRRYFPGARAVADVLCRGPYLGGAGRAARLCSCGRDGARGLQARAGRSDSHDACACAHSVPTARYAGAEQP